MLILVVTFLFASMVIVLGIVNPILKHAAIAKAVTNSVESLYLSESSVEDVLYRLKNSKQISSPEYLYLNGATTTTSVSDITGGKQIDSSASRNQNFRKTQAKVVFGTGVAFHYGVQVGQGGFIMSNNAGVNGNVYSDGNIVGSNGSFITGSAISSGSSGTVSGTTVGSGGTGDAWAHTVSNTTVAGNLYCTTGTGNNKSCNNSKGDPASTTMPVTQAMINAWESDAALGGTISGNYTFSSAGNFGPKVITGNLTINANMTITGTVYVQGTITVGNNVTVRLSSSYGSSGGVVITDGRVILSNNVTFAGSGQATSYLMLITTSQCPTGCSGLNAIDLSNNVGAVIINAQNGTVHLSNNVNLNEVVAKTVDLDNNATVTYITGLADTNFSSGPGGGFDISSWNEVP